MAFKEILRADPPIGDDVTVSVVASGTYTTVREYLASDDVWKTIPNFVDPSNDYTIIGTHRIRWSRPSDWASKTITIGGDTMTGWIERRRINAVSTLGPTNLYQVQVNSRAMGAANSQGLEMGAQTYSYATFSAGANTAPVERYQPVLRLAILFRRNEA